MQNFSVVIFILAILISVSAVTDKLKLPYPVLLVLAGNSTEARTPAGQL